MGWTHPPLISRGGRHYHSAFFGPFLLIFFLPEMLTSINFNTNSPLQTSDFGVQPLICRPIYGLIFGSSLSNRGQELVPETSTA